jgi:alpha-beta hydrolase superfamily lysophospholipase
MDASDGPILVDHWVHAPARPRGTVLALHGFAMGNPRIDAMVLLASHWYERGLDVALLTLPHHGARTPDGARFSGEHFALPHVARLSEAVREAIYEIRQVLYWLREESGAPVGVLGLSLGGYLAALSGGLLDDLDFVIPIVPPVCIGDLAWRFFTQTRHFTAGGASALSQEDLRRSFRVHSPLTHPLCIPKERAMIVAGRGDRIVPPEHPSALWRSWGEPRIHWFSGSHLAPFGRGRIARAILDHIESLEIL